MTILINDIKYGFRQLGKNPLFTAMAIITLALGLTINTIVFSYISDLYLRPLPARNPNELAYVFQRSPQVDTPLNFSYPDYQDFRTSLDDPSQSNSSMVQTFSGLLAYRQFPAHISRPGAIPEHSWVQSVSDNYFSVLGLQPLHGRLFLEGEGCVPGEDPIVVLTYDYWRRRCNSEPDIIGQTIEICCLPMTVVGVTAPGFHGTEWSRNLSGFVPATMIPNLQPAFRRMLEQRGNAAFRMMGRLRQGIDAEKAQAATDIVMSRLLEEYPQDHLPGYTEVLPERQCRPSPAMAHMTSLIVTLLMGLSLLVLGVAAVNVTNLLYTRAHEREQELAIRSAMGATRRHLLGQLMIESTLLALGAAACGLLITPWLRMALDRVLLAVSDAVPVFDYSRDWREFTFTFCTALIVALLAGALPNSQSLRLSLVPLLKQGGSRGFSRRHPVSRALVVAQIALSCLVLVCAGLAIRSMNKLAAVDLGFEPRNVLLASYNLGLHRYAVRKGFGPTKQFHVNVLEQAQAIPGVRAAALAEHVPFEDEVTWRTGFVPEGRPIDTNADLLSAPCHSVTHTFMQTMKVPIMAGRDFTIHDNDQAPSVAIINQAMARRLWPDENALDKRFMMFGQPVQVVGIVGNGCFHSMTNPTQPYVFIPLAQMFVGNITLVLRTEGDPIRYVGAVEQLIRKMEPDLPIYNVRTMQQQIAGSPQGLMPLRIGATIAGIQGGLALVLAVIGLYGLISASMAQRTQEIGIRMAMGATRPNIIIMVIKQGALLTACGLGLGSLLALVAGHWLSRLLYEVKGADTATFLVTALVLSATAILACFIPARRAAKVDPMEALRYE